MNEIFKRPQLVIGGITAIVAVVVLLFLLPSQQVGTPQNQTQPPDTQNNTNTSNTSPDSGTALPYQTDHFKVEYSTENKELNVTLFATLNKVTEKDYERYIEELKQYKAEFEEWLENNQTPDYESINFTPDLEELSIQ